MGLLLPAGASKLPSPEKRLDAECKRRGLSWDWTGVAPLPYLPWCVTVRTTLGETLLDAHGWTVRRAVEKALARLKARPSAVSPETDTKVRAA